MSHRWLKSDFQTLIETLEKGPALSSELEYLNPCVAIMVATANKRLKQSGRRIAGRWVQYPSRFGRVRVRCYALVEV